MNETISISANFTIEPVFPALSSYLDKLGVENQIQFAPFDQIFQQLLDPTSQFSLNERGLNIIYLRVEDLVDESDISSVRDELSSNIEELAEALKRSERFKAPVLLFFCPPSAEQRNDSARSAMLDECEEKLVSLVRDISNLHLISTKHVAARYSVTHVDNPKGNELAHVPYTDDFFAALGIETARKIDTHLRKPHKVIVLDCDNTLWDGVCGEDGTHGIGFSEPRLALQRFAVEQSKAGVVICICSKNNEPDVWEVFEQRTEMPLKREHLVAWRINWELKSANLKSLADELQLGLDSFIFVDDDAAVCAEVEENCPEVCTVLLPKDLDTIPRLLDHLWIFDRIKITEEDRKRTESYQREVARRRVKQESSDLSTFLERLNLLCDIREIQNEQIPRVSQLSLRTNQFNSTAVRRSESDVRQIISDNSKKIWTVTVSDRFGDYGLVGAVTFEALDDAIFIDSCLLSCRALGRGVEYRILRELGGKASELGLEFVDIEFHETAKNAPIRKFLSEIEGASTVTNSGSFKYRIPAAIAATYQPKYQTAPEPDVASESVKLTNEGPKRYSGAANHVYLEIASSLALGVSAVGKTAATTLDRSQLSTEYSDVHTDTERKLRELWQQLLKINNIGVLDSFFELGGDSLLAVSLFVEVEEIFGRSLPLSALIEAPTIAKLAAVLDQTEDSNGWKYLVQLKEGGHERPLFCMHAAGGNVLFYCDLAKELGPDQPVYGVQARGVLDKSETAHDRVEDMARDYLAEIRSIQPAGPYRLCGSSFGGLVAFEAARQLAQAGEEIELLTLFDTYAPGYLKNNTVHVTQAGSSGLLSRVRNLSNQIREIGSARERVSFILTRVNKLKMRLKRKALWKKNEFAIQYRKATGQELPVDIQRNHKAIQKALDSYVPTAYDGPIILFRASDQPENVKFDPYLGWSSFTAGEITTVDVKGTHGALTVYPFAADLGKKFGPFLQNPEPATKAAAALAFSN